MTATLNSWRCVRGKMFLHGLIIGLLWALCSIVLASDGVEIKVDGVSGRLAQNVKLHIEQLSLMTRQDARRQNSLVKRSATKGMQALGYYDCTIAIALSPPEQTSPTLTVTIKPGEPVIWEDTRVTFSGAGMEDPLFQKVVQQYGPRVGDVLNHQQYETLKKELRVQALGHGYFDVVMRRQKLLINRTSHTAHIDLELATGQRYRFGQVTFTPTQLNAEALHRLVPFKEGDYYEEALVTELNRNLLDTGYFRTVGLFPRHEHATSDADAIVPVAVELSDNEDNRVSLGLGYGTDTGPRVRLSWLMPMVNQYGHSLQFATSLAEPRQEFTSEYKIPEGNPGTDFWSLQTGYLEEVFEDNQYRQISAGVSRQQLIWDDWTGTWFTKFKREQGHIDGDEVQADLPSDAFFITPGFSISRTKVEGGMRPNRGHKLVFDLEFSDPSIGSDTEYIRVSGVAKWLTPLTDRQQILMRLQLGMLWSQNFDQVPVSARFFTGGDQSIRGYAYNSLGPRNENDALVGGSRLAVGSVEYLYRFLTNWQAAVFVDHGGALDAANSPVYTGAGMGVRWLSPLGVIALDVANAVSDDQRFRLHIRMGTVL